MIGEFTMFCQQCGKEIPKEFVVCSSCGADLTAASTAEEFAQSTENSEPYQFEQINV